MSGVALLAPMLTRANCGTLLKRATHKSKRQIEELVAELAPRPDLPGMMRKLPVRRYEASAAAPQGALAPAEPAHGGERAVDRDGAGEQRPDAVVSVSDCRSEPSRVEQCLDAVAGAEAGAGPSPLASHPVPSQAPPATMEPLAPARYGVRFTASAELHDKLERLQALMRHSVPDGDLATIIEVAVTRELERLEAKRFGKTKRPRTRVGEVDTRPKSRHIPAAVRRFVEARDEGRCTYRSKNGRRCKKRHDLEFHHHSPFGRGGPHSPEVVSLHCKVHNALMAELDYGKEKMARFRRSANRVSEGSDVYGATLPHPWGPPWPASFESRLRPGRHHGAKGEVSIWGPDKVLASDTVCSSTLSEV